MKGLSRADLLCMRAFAEAWSSEDENVQRGVAHVPWGLEFLALDSDIVRCSLAGTGQPIAVSRYELTSDAPQALTDEKTLVPAFRSGLSSSERQGRSAASAARS